MEKEKKTKDLKMREKCVLCSKKILFIFSGLVKGKNWLPTVLIFFLMFLFALKVWKEYIISQTPNQEIVIKFQNKQVEIDQKIKKIEKVIEKNKQREENFNRLPELNNLDKVFNSEDFLPEKEPVTKNSKEVIQ